MQRLLYISTARGPIEPAQLDSILAVSRRNNVAAQVTGLLVAGGRRFLQALEGPTEAVERTFTRIGADPRHFAVVVLRREKIDTRTFPDWSMGFQRGPAVPGSAGDLRKVVDTLVSEIGDPTIRAYFTGFADVNAAA